MQISDLANYGFNLEEAMELCIGDEDIYKEVLETALEEGKEKLVLFEELMASNDMDRYIIEAHGLKNAAKQIGADKLSETAKASELDGKAGNIDAMKARHEELMKMYKDVCDAIEQLF